jgi:hypothetical protein
MTHTVNKRRRLSPFGVLDKAVALD